MDEDDFGEFQGDGAEDFGAYHGEGGESLGQYHDAHGGAGGESYGQFHGAHAHGASGESYGQFHGAHAHGASGESFGQYHDAHGGEGATFQHGGDAAAHGSYQEGHIDYGSEIDLSDQPPPLPPKDPAIYASSPARAPDASSHYASAPAAAASLSPGRQGVSSPQRSAAQGFNQVSSNSTAELPEPVPASPFRTTGGAAEGSGFYTADDVEVVDYSKGAGVGQKLRGKVGHFVHGLMHKRGGGGVVSAGDEMEIEMGEIDLGEDDVQEIAPRAGAIGRLEDKAKAMQGKAMAAKEAAKEAAAPHVQRAMEAAQKNKERSTRLWKQFSKRERRIIINCAKFFVMLLFFTITVSFYTNVEGWSVVETIYFLVVTTSTTGYGDLTPTTDGSRLFTIFVIIIGLFLVFKFFADTLTDVVRDLLNWATERLQPARKKTDGKLHTNWKIKTAITATFLVILVGSGTVYFMAGEGWGFIHALYWTVCTSTTVGYGDLKITRDSERIFIIFYILFSVVSLAAGFAIFYDLVETKRYNKAYEKILHMHFNADDVKQLEGEQIDKITFVALSLEKLGMIDRKVHIDPFVRRFDELDVDQKGFITSEVLAGIKMASRAGVQRGDPTEASIWDSGDETSSDDEDE